MHSRTQEEAHSVSSDSVSKACWQSGYAADCKSVDLGSTPGRASIATLAQLVERDLAKVEVTSSNLVCRSKLKNMECTRYSRWCAYHRKVLRALVVELVDTRDLKSLGVRAVPVQVRPGAPSIKVCIMM